jgi:Glycosyl hydrolase family 26
MILSRRLFVSAIAALVTMTFALALARPGPASGPAAGPAAGGRPETVAWAPAVLPAAPAVARVSASRSGDLVPARGALLGAFTDLDGGWAGTRAAQRGVTLRESQLGRVYRIDHHYYPFDNPWPWPGSLERWDRAHGRIPLVTWQGADPDRIARGSLDRVIRDRARRVRAFGAPIFVRFAAEMNGLWSPMNASRTQRDPSRYVAAWRHVVDVFRDAGASNAVFVWCPNAVDDPAADWNHWTNYYPGDGYVDWVGIDGYNWGDRGPWSPWESFGAIMQGVYDDYAGRKPIMIAETSSVESSSDPSAKASWIAAAGDWTKSHPAVAALVWFDTRKERNWRVDSSSPTRAAYRRLANDPYFRAQTG